MQGTKQRNKCLKAYQRSAADQEESLPHELRPAETLSDCCWYLCAQLCTEEVCPVLRKVAHYDIFDLNDSIMHTKNK